MSITGKIYEFFLKRTGLPGNNNTTAESYTALFLKVFF